jgi:hypothetical protein
MKNVIAEERELIKETALGTEAIKLKEITSWTLIEAGPVFSISYVEYMTSITLRFEFCFE